MTILKEVEGYLHGSRGNHITVTKVVSRNYLSARRAKQCMLCRKTILESKCREIHYTDGDPNVLEAWGWAHWDFGVCLFKIAVK